MKFIDYRIKDTNFKRLVIRFLKAGVMEDGIIKETEKGTPQGGIISPILANIYLHFVYDLWFKATQKKSNPENNTVRYADDCCATFQYEWAAKKFVEQLKERMNKFGLELQEEKTKIIEFGRYAARNRKARGEGKPETFDFLGFTHYCSISRKNGKFRAKRKTSRKKLKSKTAAMKKWIKENMHKPVKELTEQLNVKLIGHYNYYGITDNLPSIRKFRHVTIKMLYKAINKRSQKNRYSWAEFYEKMVKDKIVIPTVKKDILALHKI